MSILLEALRKSEKSQRSREVPSIYSPGPSSTSPESLKIVPVVMLLVLATMVCGWFVWNQYRSPADVEQISAEETPEPSPENSSESGQKQIVAVESSAKNVPQGADSTKQISAQRTPVETYQAPAEKTDDSLKPEDKAKQPAVNTNSKNTDGTKSSQPASKPATKPESKKAKAKGNVNGKKKEVPKEPEPIGYWDLPDSVRASVPQIKFNVLVYDKNPGDRFVLINGERLTQGDSYQPGLVVKEIRRDGVVFSYRLYKFLIEK